MWACILTYDDSGQCHHMIGYSNATGGLRLGHYHNPNLKLVLKVWIPVAFLMRLAMKMSLEKKISIFFKHRPPTSNAVLAS